MIQKHIRYILHDPQIMAAQLCLPISVWINLCDREPEHEEEVMGLIERHVQQFFEMYGNIWRVAGESPCVRRV